MTIYDSQCFPLFLRFARSALSSQISRVCRGHDFEWQCENKYDCLWLSIFNHVCTVHGQLWLHRHQDLVRVRCVTDNMRVSMVITFTYTFHLSRSLTDRWCTTVDFTTSFLHSSRFSAFRSMIFHSRPVHSLMLSSHRFFCLPIRLPPWTVPCRIVLASPDDRVTCLYHFSLRLFTGQEVFIQPSAFPILAVTSSLVMWSLYEILRNLRKHLLFSACILLSMSAVMVHISHAYKNMDMARERISLTLELMVMFLSFQMILVWLLQLWSGLSWRVLQTWIPHPIL